MEVINFIISFTSIVISSISLGITISNIHKK